MANADFPTGFQQINDEGVDPVLFKAEVDSSNGNIIGSQDAITREADGNVTRSAANDGVNVLGTVQQIFDTDGVPLLRLAASTAGTVYYIPAKDRRFVIQSDSGTTVAATAIGATANFVVTGDADSTTGKSKMELDSSDIGTGLQLRIEGKTDASVWGEEHVDLIVSFNESVGQAGTATI